MLHMSKATSDPKDEMLSFTAWGWGRGTGGEGKEEGDRWISLTPGCWGEEGGERFIWRLVANGDGFERSNLIFHGGGLGEVGELLSFTAVG